MILGLKRKFLVYVINFIIIGVVFINDCSGQDAFIVDHLSTEDGLSKSDVNCIYLDNQGFMWFGTHEGLNKYYGYQFTVFNPDLNDLNSNLIFALEGDENGNLWIGTTGSGLTFFEKKHRKIQFLKIEKVKFG